MLNNMEAVLFDLDGTLVESMSMWGDIDVEYLKKISYTCAGGAAAGYRGLKYVPDGSLF